MIVGYSKFMGVKKYVNKRPEKNTRSTSGLSKKSAIRINTAITFLNLSTKKKYVFQKETGKYYTFRLNFITLTLHAKQLGTDREVLKNILEPFLRICRNKYSGFLYVWKAEVQDNGNLHFHLNTNVFITHTWLRKTWNDLQRKSGVVADCVISEPNSTDVKAVLNTKELASYMAKYISKADLYKKPLKRYLSMYKKKLSNKEDYCVLPKNYFANIKRKVEIKLWSCSQILNNVKYNIEGIYEAIYNDMKVVANTCEIVPLEYITLYKGVRLDDRRYPEINRIYYEMIRRVKEYEKDLITKHEVSS